MENKNAMIDANLNALIKEQEELKNQEISKETKDLTEEIGEKVSSCTTDFSRIPISEYEEYHYELHRLTQESIEESNKISEEYNKIKEKKPNLSHQGIVDTLIKEKVMEKTVKGTNYDDFSFVEQEKERRKALARQNNY